MRVTPQSHGVFHKWHQSNALANMAASGSQFSSPFGYGKVVVKKELFGMTQIQIQLDKTVRPFVL